MKKIFYSTLFSFAVKLLGLQLYPNNAQYLHSCFEQMMGSANHDFKECAEKGLPPSLLCLDLNPDTQALFR